MPQNVKAVRFRFLLYLVVFVIALVGGTRAFMVLEGMGFGESLYFVVVTMATVGYGDISPATPVGRVVAVVVIVLGVGTFLGVIASATELLIARRAEASRREKLNMVIGLFFSEVGTDLLTVSADADPQRDQVRDLMQVEGDWGEGDFAQVRSKLQKRTYTLDPDRLSLLEVARLMKGKRAFIVGLLENSAVMEHEAFTDVLWAVFHVVDELEAEDDLSAVLRMHEGHIMGDCERAYRRLVGQWLRYMEHMQRRYPYLFNRALRSNPFVMKKSKVLEKLEGNGE